MITKTKRTYEEIEKIFSAALLSPYSERLLIELVDSEVEKRMDRILADPSTEHLLVEPVGDNNIKHLIKQTQPVKVRTK
jgi:hypothetical protein